VLSGGLAFLQQRSLDPSDDLMTPEPTAGEYALAERATTY
jgi:hypothetical protein